MPSLKSLIRKLFGLSSRLSALDLLILTSIRSLITVDEADLWDKQFNNINKIQRLPEGVEVNFYRMKDGRPSFDAELAFANKTEELLVATVKVRIAGVEDSIIANLWCVRGYIFSIEYIGNIEYFEKAAGTDPTPTFQIDCEVKADLSGKI